MSDTKTPLPMGMEEALRQGFLASGRSAPRPPVGAAIVKNGQVIARAFKQPGGGPHAEALAIQLAGAEARDSTLYTTLEPCNHHGKTPPCTEAIIAAGIREVHFSLIDPNPIVDGAGCRRLKEAGIQVFIGEGKEQALAQLSPFFHFIRTREPYVIQLTHTSAVAPYDVADVVIRDADAIQDGIITDIVLDAQSERQARDNRPIQVVICNKGFTRQIKVQAHGQPVIIVLPQSSPAPTEKTSANTEYLHLKHDIYKDAGRSELLQVLGARNCMLAIYEGDSLELTTVDPTLAPSATITELYT